MRALPLTAFALLVVAALPPQPAAAATTQPPAQLHWHEQLQPALAEAAAADRYLLVDLYAEWCGWCKKLERDVFTSPRFRAAAAERFVLLRVDVEDGGEGSRLQQQFAAGSLPTTLVLAASGPARVGAVQGYHPADRFLLRVDAEIERWETLLAAYREALGGDDPTTLRGLAEELRQRGDGARAAAAYRRLLAAGGEPEGGRGWLYLLLADSLRQSGDLAGAAGALAGARTAADPALVEAADLFEMRLARDRGDCVEAEAAAEAFLAEHPRSRFAAGARSALDELRGGSAAGCT